MRVSSSRERSGSQLATTLVGRLARAGLISLTGLALLAFAACDLMPSAATPPTPTHIPFGVSGVAVTATAPVDGLCAASVPISFSAAINVIPGGPGGVVTYHWARSDGTSTAAATLSFAPGEASHTATSTWTLPASAGTSAARWTTLVVTAPAPLTSPQANFTLTCSPHVTSASASVSPTVYNCGNETMVFTGVIHLSPTGGGSMTYHWVQDDATVIGPKTVRIAPGTTTLTVTTGRAQLPHTGYSVYWDKLVVTSPNTVTSNESSYTLTCI